MEAMMQTDVAIIGAGPAGLFAAFQCGMLGLRCHVFDALPEIGGQCTALYPDKPIYDIPACPRITGAELIANLEAQAMPFEPEYHLGVPVVDLVKEERRFFVRNRADVQVECGAVIIAGGSGAFGPNRPPLEGIEAFEGKSVFYMVRRREDFAGKRVVIAGGGDSAVDWALSLADIARVSVIHRRDQFRAAPDSVSKMKAMADMGKIDLVVPYQLKRLVGDGGMLSAVEVATLEGAVKTIEADALLAFFGLAAKLGPIADWGLALSGHSIITDPASAETSVSGVYAAGDVATYDGKLKLISIGFAEAAKAAHSAYQYIYPDRAMHMEYSTSKGIPGEKGADISAISS